MASTTAPVAQPESLTPARIIAAAAVLFAERGYAGVSMRDIAAAVDRNVSTVHHHVGHKDDLYLAVFEEMHKREWDALESAVRRHLGDDVLADGTRAVAGFLDVLDDYLDFLVDEPTFAPLWLRRNLDARSELDDMWRRYALPQFALILDRLQEATDLGTIRPLNPELILRTVAWMTHCYLAGGLPDFGGNADPRDSTRIDWFRRYLRRLMALALTGADDADALVEARR